jgi:hypothetical protein
MSHKKFRFKISKLSPTEFQFSFPNHSALMHLSKSKNLIGGDEPAGVSVFVGNDLNYRIGWKMRSTLTTDERVEFSLYDSKEKKQVSVWIETRELIRGLILGKEHILENEDYRIWE